MHKGFLQENPTITKTTSTTVAPDVEKARAGSMTKSTSRKGKENTIVEEGPSCMPSPLPAKDEEEESLCVPLVRRCPKKTSANMTRSAISESILDRLPSERVPASHVTGNVVYSW